MSSASWAAWRGPTAGAILAMASLAPTSLSQSPPVADTFGEVLPQRVPAGYKPADLPPVPPGLRPEIPPHTPPPIPIGPPSGLPQPGTPESKAVPVEQQAPAAGAFTYFRKQKDTPTGQSRSDVPEPSAAQNRDTCFQTGNWYASLSRDAGMTWQNLSPATFFSTNPDGGFCCDQRVEHVFSHDLTVWLLQYSYSASTQKNTYRFAVANGRNKLRSGTASDWVLYDFNPQTFGYAAGTWLDFPDVAAGGAWFHCSANVYDASSNYVGSVRWRMELADMQAGTSLTYSYGTSATIGGGFAYRFAADNSGTKVWFAAFQNTTTLRVWEYDETAGSQNYVDKSIPSWTNATASCPGPDGRDWCGRVVGRLRGSYESSSEIGFLFTSAGNGGTRPQPYTRVERFDKSRNSIGSQDIWSSTLAFAYGAADSNSQGDVGISCAIGSAASYVHTSATIVDGYQPWGGLTFYTMNTGTSGPGSNRWGDYFDVQQNWVDRRTFVGTGACQTGGATNSGNEPWFAWFGRDDYTPTWVNLSVASTPISGALVQIAEADRFGNATGTAAFTRSYTPRQGYTLTAASSTLTSGSNVFAFDRWVINGANQPVGQTAVTVSDIGNLDDTATTSYKQAPPLSVTCSRAGVSIGVSPADVQGNATGTAPFTRYYVATTTVNLAAPATSGGIPFKRWLVNGALATTSPNLTLSFSATSTAAAEYFVYTPGSFASYGAGCPGSGGVVPVHSGSGTPELGQAMGWNLSSARPSSPCALYVGASNTLWNGTPLPLSLAPFGMGTCFLRQSLDVTLGMATSAGGTAGLALAVPNNTSLIGAHLYTEFAVVDPGTATPLKIVHSNALDTTFGGLQ